MKLSNALIHKAVFLAEEAFKDRKDKNGFPYIGHLYRVASRVEELGGGPAAIAAAMLHDFIEDIPAGLPIDWHPEFNSFPDSVKSLVKIVSRRKDETYKQFIMRIIESENDEALMIKLADMRDNMDPARYHEEAPNSRYEKWYPVLLEAYEMAVGE